MLIFLVNSHSNVSFLLQVSHGNCSNHAKSIGDNVLSKICGLIAADEARHEMAYKKVFKAAATKKISALPFTLSR